MSGVLFCVRLEERLKRLTWKLKFDCNSTSHQSGTEELHEKRMRAYLGNIQRNVSIEL